MSVGNNSKSLIGTHPLPFFLLTLLATEEQLGRVSAKRADLGEIGDSGCPRRLRQVVGGDWRPGIRADRARLVAHHSLLRDAGRGRGPGTFYESSLEPLKLKPTQRFSRQRQIILTGPGNFSGGSARVTRRRSALNF